ncbi:twin-arginine translocation signal domain-containing protein [Steroidobacter sp.]|uniref:twin-arginine translocation signal domain-containing protein n=1 Tax=Steroidobacter sp. TaxID=1978227 RepID=UPI001A6006FA|nr:twin-arginine translocation signal domain-containing protein [Steroidobacter sp.]MBL8271066.1 twin-arginine translocation signal domain-containing protein [Steroidobacter sp.]
MSTRRGFLKQTAAAGVVTAVPSWGAHRTDGLVARVEGRIGSNRIAKKSIARVRSVIRREETVLRHGGNGDNWHMSWASDDRQYVSLCDGSGFSDQPRAFYNSRMIAISGGPRDAQFHDLAGYPMLARPTQRQNDTRYYNFGTLALDGYFFQFMSTFNRPFRPNEEEEPDRNNLIRFNGAKLIYSPDSGRTWHNQNGSTPVVWEDWNQRSREALVFFEEDQEAFSLLTILQMGRNYEHNRDGYIYVYAPNGNTEGTMNELVMFRVLKGKLLERSSYEYFVGRTAKGGAIWSKDIMARATVHTFPRGWVNSLVHPYAWHPSVVYNAPLGLYLMANWGMGAGLDGMWFSRPSYLGFWIAANPWGPWTQVHEETSWLPAGEPNARAYQPQIAPKWISDDGRSFWIVWTDFQVTDEKARRLAAEEYKRIANAGTSSETDVMRSAMSMRQYMPYYAFNVQRVELVIA